MVRLAKTNQAIQWQIRQECIIAGSKENTSLLLNITGQLEAIIKHKYLFQ
jgi:hypothetical protein